MATRDAKGRGGGLAWLAIAVLLFGIPSGLLLGLLAGRGQLAGLSDQPAPLVEPARVIEFDDRTGVTADFTWDEGPRLYAPDWSGVVGEVRLRAGEAVHTGTAIGSVDGVKRLTVASPQPFFRRLTLGDEGSDVVWLHASLVTLGYLEQSRANDTLVSEATMSAVRALAAELGATGGIDAFDPAWFVWLPVEPFTVASVEMAAGAPAPPTGTPIAAGPSRLSSMDLRRVDGAALGLEPAVKYVLELAGERLQLDSETRTVDAEGLTRLTAALPTLAASASGSVTRATPLTVWSLPSAAIMVNLSGQLCIWVDNDGEYEALPAEVVGGRAGVSFVVPEAPTANVLQNPAQILADPSCP